MKRPMVLSLMAAALALAGCQVTPIPGDGNGGTTNPWQTATQTTAASEPGTAIRTNESVTRNAPDYYQVNVPARLGEPLIYVELAGVTGGDAVVEVFSADTPRQSVYASRSAAWFGLSQNVLTLGEEELGAAQIVVDATCRGPCIIIERTRPNEEVNLYVRVSTAGAGTVRYNLHVYDDPYQDPGEPQVSQCQGFPGITAASVPASVFEAAQPGLTALSAGEPAPASIIVQPVPDQRFRGALETVGDRDCYRVGQAVSRVALARVTDNQDITIRADVYRTNTTQLLGTLLVERGQQEDVVSLLGTETVDIVVYSGNNRAGPSGTSSYELFFPAN